MYTPKRWFLVTFASLCALIGVASAANTPAVESLLGTYRAAGASAPVASRGAAAWVAETPGPDGAPRSCATCHTRDLRAAGRHATTGEVIEPMAPSVAPDRLTDAANVEKWFRRNCRWTYGRECTPQEKSDFLTYIQH